MFDKVNRTFLEDSGSGFPELELMGSALNTALRGSALNRRLSHGKSDTVDSET